MCAHTRVCVCWCGFPSAAAFPPLMSSKKVAQHIPTCLSVSLCAKACLDLNNNGGSDPDRCFTAVTPSHSGTPPPTPPLLPPQLTFSTPSKACESLRSDAVSRSAGAKAGALRRINTHRPCSGKTKSTLARNKNKTPAILDEAPAAPPLLPISPRNDQRAK